MVDLHVHSNASDGSYTPTELVEYASKKEITSFALTDHDTMDGVPEAVNYAKENPFLNVEVIPGIELSCQYEGKDIHIVGLYVNYKDEDLMAQLEQFKHSREGRNEKMCERLQNRGVDISIEDLRKAFPDSVITRGLVARLMKEKGYVKSMREAFERYIGDRCDCYVPREFMELKDAIDFIHKGRGIAVLAHPTLYHYGHDKLEELIEYLKGLGLDAIEAKYTTYSASEEREIKEFAMKYDLLISGGSDFHGSTKPETDLGVGYGKLYIHESFLEKINEVRKIKYE